MKPVNERHRAGTFETFECQLSTYCAPCDTVLVSGLRLSEINKLSVGAFVEELSYFLATLALSPNQVIVAGDVNLLWNRVNACTHGSTIQAALGILGLTQYVCELTHQDGNTLNWRISRQISCVDKVWVGDHFSDQFVYTYS